MSWLRPVLGVLVMALCACTGGEADDDATPSGDDDDTATKVRSPEPPPWEAPGTEDPAAFAWGVQSGDVTDSAVLLSARTTEPSLLLSWQRAEGETWVTGGSQEVTVAEGVARVELSGLQADTAHAYAFTTPDGGRRSRVGRFRTALAGDGNRVIRFAATSCLGDDNPGFPSLSQVAEEAPDFLLLLGDTVYANATTVEEYREFWKTALASTGLADATASTSIVATWDDHEIRNDWSWDLFPGEEDAAQFEAALSAFREALPQREGPGGTGIWRLLSWGETLDLFVLDSRGERRDGRYVSVEQMDWLKQGLSTSHARFKVILNSVPITDFYDMMYELNASDRWQGFPSQRDEILNHIEDEALTGVVWLSGDFHMGAVSHIGRPGDLADGQWEVLTGPTGSTVNPLATLYPESEQYPLLVDFWNTVLIEADPGLGTMEIRFVGDDGSVMAETVLDL